MPWLGAGWRQKHVVITWRMKTEEKEYLVHVVYKTARYIGKMYKYDYAEAFDWSNCHHMTM
jgi:hypothetical protein